ncbi:MAG TPA: hypothetical protein VGH38_22080, partial [Bryobacteraceae bacterium]
GKVLQSEQRQLEAIVNADLTEQARQIHLHGTLGDPQLVGDFLVLEALGARTPMAIACEANSVETSSKDHGRISGRTY